MVRASIALRAAVTRSRFITNFMKKHNIKPNVFLNYVHDINFDKFEKDHKLNILLKKINGKKIIFTNADKKYALKVITKLGIRKNFRYIFDIKDANYVPKPDIYSYKKMGLILVLNIIAENLPIILFLPRKLS